MDIKPSNFIFVTNENGLSKLLAIDFDHAMMLDNSSSEFVLPLGYSSVTWEYASPEVAIASDMDGKGANVDGNRGAPSNINCYRCTPHQYDIWSLGITALEVFNNGRSFCSELGGDVQEIKTTLKALNNETIEQHILCALHNNCLEGKEFDGRVMRAFFSAVLQVVPDQRRKAENLGMILGGRTVQTVSALGRQIQDLQASQSAQRNMLGTLLTGQFKVPRLMIVLPKDRTTLYGKAKSLFADKLLLHFICPVTLQRGAPYVVTQLRGWVAKALPAIRFSLLVLQVALLCAGLPIPALQNLVPAAAAVEADDLAKAVNLPSSPKMTITPPLPSAQQQEACMSEVEKHREEIEMLLESLQSMTDSIEASTEDDQALLAEIHTLWEANKQQQQPTTSVNVEDMKRLSQMCERSYQSIYVLIRSKLEPCTPDNRGLDWKPRNTGLVCVTSDKDGTTEWILDKPSVIKRFHKMGKEALIL